MSLLYGDFIGVDYRGDEGGYLEFRLHSSCLYMCRAYVCIQVGEKRSSVVVMVQNLQ